MEWKKVKLSTAIKTSRWCYSDYEGFVQVNEAMRLTIDGKREEELFVKDAAGQYKQYKPEKQFEKLPKELFVGKQKFDRYGCAVRKFVNGRYQYEYEYTPVEQDKAHISFSTEGNYNRYSISVPIDKLNIDVWQPSENVTRVPQSSDLQFKSELKIGDKICYNGKGTCEVVVVFDRPNRENKLATLKKTHCLHPEDEALFDVVWDDNNLLALPYTYEPVNECDIFNDFLNEGLLQPVVIGANGTINVCWRKLPDAAAYNVELWRQMSSLKGLRQLYHLKTYLVDRNDGFISIENLVGSGFIVRVTAENREGEIIAKSRGIGDSGQPKFWD